MNSKRKILIFTLALTAVFVFSIKLASAYNAIYDGTNEKTCSDSGYCIIGGGGDVCTTKADCTPPGSSGPANGQLITQSLPAFSCQLPYTNSNYYCGYPNGTCSASFASAGSGYGWSVNSGGTSVNFNPSPSTQALNITLTSVAVDDAGIGTGWSHTGCTCGCQDQSGSNCATTIYPNAQVWSGGGSSFSIWGSDTNWCVPNGWGVWGSMNASYQVQSLVCNPGYVVSGSSCVLATGTLVVRANLPGVNFTVAGPGGKSYTGVTALNKNKNGYFAAIISYVYAATTYSWTQANAVVGQYSITSNDLTESSGGVTYNFDPSTSNTSANVPLNGTGTITLNYTASPPTATLSASPSSITQGQSSTLTWSSTNATSCSGSWTTSTLNTSGTNSVTPSQTTSYTITCSGPGGSGSASASATVNVGGLSSPTATLSVSPLSVTTGQTITYNWSSTNATSWSWALSIYQNGTPVSADACGNSSSNWTGPPGGASASGSWSGTIASCQAGYTYTFTYTATGSGGSASTSATVNVAAAPAWANLSISDGNFYVGDSWILTLTSNQPLQSITFCAILPNGTKSCTPNFGTTNNQGSWTDSGTFTPDTVGSWTEWAVVGQATSNQISFTVTNKPNSNSPTATLSASPSSITQGQSSTLTWSSTNATSCSGSWTTSTLNTSGTNSVTPSQTTSYTITCSGPGGSGSASASATVNVAAPQPLPTISLSGGPFSYTASWGASSPNEATQFLTITNSGQANSTLNWQVSSNQSWITFSQNSGSLAYGQSASIALNINPSSLAPGSYKATIAISDPNATNSPQSTNVSLTVYDCSKRTKLNSVGPIVCKYGDTGNASASCISGANLGGIILSSGFSVSASKPLPGETVTYSCTWQTSFNGQDIPSSHVTDTLNCNPLSVSTYPWTTIGKYTAQFAVNEVSSIGTQVCSYSATATQVFSVLPNYQETFLRHLLTALYQSLGKLFAFVK